MDRTTGGVGVLERTVAGHDIEQRSAEHVGLDVTQPGLDLGRRVLEAADQIVGEELVDVLLRR